MCKIVQDCVVEGKIECVENLLKKGFSLDEALETAELDRETYEEYYQNQ